MDTNMLIDTWTTTGTNYEKFEALLRDIDASTEILPIATNELDLISVKGAMVNRAGIGEPEDWNIPLLVYNAQQSSERKLPGHSGISIETIEGKGGTQEFIDDFMRSQLILRAQNRIFFTYCPLSRDLGARAQITGNGLNNPTPERSAFLAHRYAAAPCEAYLVVRSNKSDTGHIHKVFAMPSSGYRYIPQANLLDIAQYFKTEMRGIESKFWSVSHEISQIWLEFPNQAKDISSVYRLPDTLVPGVLLETSDTGDCALKVIPTWSRAMRPERIRAPHYKREHKGKFDLNEILDKVKDTVFTVYTKLPERLCELLAIDIPDPNAFWEAALETIKLKSLLGTRRYIALLDALQSELNPAVSYTVYDLVMRFMDIPAYYSGALREELEALAYRFPFTDFNKIISKAAPIALTA